MISSVVTRFAAVSFLLVFAVSPGLAQGGGAIAGTVTNSRLEPLDGVQVSVQGVPVSVRTDSRGHFRLTNVTGSRATLQVTRIGFRPITQEAAVGETDLRPAMPESAVRLSEIGVTGAPGREPKR